MCVCVCVCVYIYIYYFFLPLFFYKDIALPGEASSSKKPGQKFRGNQKQLAEGEDYVHDDNCCQGGSGGTAVKKAQT